MNDQTDQQTGEQQNTESEGSNILQCSKCSKKFKVVQLEKQLYEKLGLPNPSYCPSCRSEMRNMWRNKRQLVKGTCASCGKDIVTTPKFSDNVKIYCKDCYQEYNEKNDNLIK